MVSFRRLGLLAVAIVGVLVVPATASAVPYIKISKRSTPTVKYTGELRGVLKSAAATFTTASGTVSCNTSTVTGTVLTAGTGTAPTVTVSGTITGGTFTTPATVTVTPGAGACPSTITGVDRCITRLTTVGSTTGVKSWPATGQPDVNKAGTTDTAEFRILTPSFTLTCHVTLTTSSTSCTYVATGGVLTAKITTPAVGKTTIQATFPNPNRADTTTNMFTNSPAGFGCPATGTFSAQYHIWGVTGADTRVTLTHTKTGIGT